MSPALPMDSDCWMPLSERSFFYPTKSQELAFQLISSQLPGNIQKSWPWSSLNQAFLRNNIKYFSVLVRKKRKECINVGEGEAKGERLCSIFIPKSCLPEKQKLIYHIHMWASGVKLRTIIMIRIVEFRSWKEKNRFCKNHICILTIHSNFIGFSHPSLPVTL